MAGLPLPGESGAAPPAAGCGPLAPSLRRLQPPQHQHHQRWQLAPSGPCGPAQRQLHDLPGRRPGGFTGHCRSGQCHDPYAATIGQDPTGAYAATAGAYLDDLGVWTKTLTPLQVSGICLAGSINHVSFAPAVVLAPPRRPGDDQQHLGTTLSYGGGGGSQFILMTTNALPPRQPHAGWAPVTTNTAPREHSPSRDRERRSTTSRANSAPRRSQSIIHGGPGEQPGPFDPHAISTSRPRGPLEPMKEVAWQ